MICKDDLHFLSWEEMCVEPCGGSEVLYDVVIWEIMKAELNCHDDLNFSHWSCGTWLRSRAWPCRRMMASLQLLHHRLQPEWLPRLVTTSLLGYGNSWCRQRALLLYLGQANPFFAHHWVPPYILDNMTTSDVECTAETCKALPQVGLQL